MNERGRILHAWAVGPIEKQADGKRCHTRVLVEMGNDEEVLWTGITREPLSVSCKMILKEGRLHMGMLQHSFLWDELALGDLVQVHDEDWDDALKRDEARRVDCPAWNKEICGICLKRFIKRTPEEWAKVVYEQFCCDAERWIECIDNMLEREAVTDPY
jgi:hypothetical protein